MNPCDHDTFQSNYCYPCISVTTVFDETSNNRCHDLTIADDGQVDRGAELRKRMDMHAS